MNERDVLRDMREAKRERIERLNNDPKSRRRHALIQKMQDQEGLLAPAELDELRKLQRHFNLPTDF